MRNHKIAAAVFCGLAVLACVIAFTGDASAATHAVTRVAHEFTFGDVLYAASPAVLALRAEYETAIAAARAKAAEVVDGMAPDAVRAIETSHRELLGKAEAIQVRLRAAEDEAARAAPTPAPAPAATPTPEQATAAERTRCIEIQNIGSRAALDRDVINTAITSGASVEAFRVQAFDQLAQRSLTTAVTPTNVQVTGNEVETRNVALSAAIQARMAQFVPGARIEVPEAARQFMEMGLVEMAAHVIGHRGHVRTAAAVLSVFERAFHSTSDFPGIFGDAINKRLLARYQTAPATYRSIAANYMATDFRPTNVIRAGDFPSLQPVSETGEIKQGTFSESKETFRVYPYAVGLHITRQMMVNDNLNAIEQVLGSAGQRVADWENAKVIAYLLLNSALLTDNVAMFHATHGNLPTAAAISVASVGIGRAAMMKQMSLDGLKLNLQPAVLFTGPDKQTEAEQLLTTITPAQTSNAVPESMRKIKPLADGNVGAGNKWWLFADPQIAPVLVYGYLEGFTGPRLTMDNKFGVQGVGVQLEHDFGVSGIDFRGAVYNSGA